MDQDKLAKVSQQVDVTENGQHVIKLSKRRGQIEQARQNVGKVAGLMGRGMRRMDIAIVTGLPMGTVDGYMHRVRQEASRHMRQTGLAEVLALQSTDRLKAVSDKAFSKLDTEQGPAWADRVIGAERVILDKLGPVREQAGTGSVSLIFQGQLPAQAQPELGQVIEGQVKELPGPEETETDKT